MRANFAEFDQTAGMTLDHKAAVNFWKVRWGTFEVMKGEIWDENWRCWIGRSCKNSLDEEPDL
jgi:hypothetical protein